MPASMKELVGSLKGSVRIRLACLKEPYSKQKTKPLTKLTQVRLSCSVPVNPEYFVPRSW